MRYTFFASNRNKNPSCGFSQKNFNRSYASGGYSHSVTPAAQDKKTLILERKITTALKCYKDDKDTQSEIINKVSMYPVNVTIAQTYQDRDAEKKLYHELVKYLDQKITEGRCNHG